MKIFVTLGTTKFDSLVKHIDCSIMLKNHDITIQSTGEFKPKNHSSFEFIDDINQFYISADVIITHAGAGSVYKLLELGKKIIVVPNFERKDKHQSDLAKYVESNQFALVAWDVIAIEDKLKDIVNGYAFAPYSSIKFDKFKEINDYLLS